MGHVRRIPSSRSSPSKRVSSASRREVFIDTKRARSRPSSSKSSDSNAILTSRSSKRASRPSSEKAEKNEAVATPPPISDVEFYSKSARQLPRLKSQFERTYEEKVSRFLLADGSSDFQPLDSEVSAQSSIPPSSAGDSTQTGECVIPMTRSLDNDQEYENTDQLDKEMAVNPESVLKETQNPSFICQYLIRSADLFLEEAHLIVLSANSVEGTKAYFRLVKAALKALHTVAAKYMATLSPPEAATVYYKLATIYFDETESYSSADTYAKKALNIATKSGLVSFMLAAELLCAKILEVSDPPLLQPFLRERQQRHEAEGRQDLACLFACKRLETASSNDLGQILQALEKATSSASDSTLRSISLLLQAKLHILSGSLKAAEAKLHECRGAFLQIKNVQPQLKAMLYLQYLSICNQTNDFKHGKKWIQKLTDFVKAQSQDQWKMWNDDGSVPVSIANGLRDPVSFSVQWIGSDELLPTIHLMCGIYYLNESTDTSKAQKIFQTCITEVERGLTSLTTPRSGFRKFRISHLTKKIVRLSCLRFLAMFYSVWLGLMTTSDLSGMKFVKGFLEAYNADNFTAEELWYYSFLVPSFHYLLAMMYQAQGNLKASKYHFLKVRNLESKGTSIPSEAMALQQALGMGLRKASADFPSELYIYSTLHLLIITEYEFRSLSQEQTSSSQHEQASRKSRSFLASLHSDMTKIMEAPALSDTITSNKLFTLTYKSALAIFYGNGLQDPGRRLDSTLASEIERLVSADSVKVQNVELLAFYILLRLAVNLEKSNKIYGKCIRRLSKAEDNGKILSLFVYLEAQRRETSAGDVAKAEKIQRKIDSLTDSIKGKIVAARSSILQSETNISGREI